LRSNYSKILVNHSNLLVINRNKKKIPDYVKKRAKQ